jgi:hypothetical protein
VIDAFSHRLCQRDVETLDLEILHYVYDNTGPGSILRGLFVHVAMSYGNQDAFVQMMRDMPLMFHTDYALEQGLRARKWEDQIAMDPCDLSQFLAPGDNLPDSESHFGTFLGSGKEKNSRSKKGRDGSVGLSETKRKKTRRE